MFTLAKRKLQKLHTGFYVSVPPEWIRHHKLDKGSLVTIKLDAENRLVVQKDDLNTGEIHGT